MKTIRLIATVILIALFWGCQPQNELTNEKKEEILKEVKQASQNYWDHMKKDCTEENLEIAFSFFEKDAEQLWQTEPVLGIFNLYLINSRDQFEKDLTDIFNERKRTKIDLLELRYLVLNEEYVLEVITSDYNVVSNEDEIIGPLEMQNTTLWRKSEQGWKIVTFHNSYRKKREVKSED